MALHLYRGTSLDWPGSPTFQSIRVTSTSSDPVVATIFAIHCDRVARGVLHITPRARLAGLEVEGNCLKELEKEVAIGLPPTEFVSHVTHTVTAADARSTLASLGVDLPVFIFTLNDLSRALHTSPRLDEQRILDFDALILAVKP